MYLKVVRTLILVLILGVVGTVQKTLAQTNPRIVREVRHELVTLPYYGVFDWLTYEVQNDGTVVLVRDAWASGLTVVLFHGANLYTVYFHLSRADVAEGDQLRRGQRVGALGASACGGGNIGSALPFSSGFPSN